MSEYVTKFGSLDQYAKGGIDVIAGDAKHYVFSNVFEVASHAKAWEKIAVAKNMEYVLEVIRAEGTSEWRSCAHDEFPLCLDGEVTIELAELTSPVAAAGSNGSIALGGEPDGRPMGRIVLRRGHMALLPANAAYRFSAPTASVILLQTVAGADTIERWAEICLS
ncbi:MAG TPA: hypothetical protein VIT64_10305 [Ilumatobacteraceae bacterium]|jgi:hypothetical protein